MRGNSAEIPPTASYGISPERVSRCFHQGYRLLGSHPGEHAAAMDRAFAFRQHTPRGVSPLSRVSVAADRILSPRAQTGLRLCGSHRSVFLNIVNVPYANHRLSRGKWGSVQILTEFPFPHQALPQAFTQSVSQNPPSPPSRCPWPCAISRVISINSFSHTN